MSSPLAFIPIISDLLGIAKEAVTDKDKLNEINLKIMELQHGVQMAILQSTTTPKVDAAVKLIYALVSLSAPIGAAATTAFGMLMHYLEATGKIPHGSIDGQVHFLIDSAFPAWGAANHVQNQKKGSGPTIPHSGPPR